MTRPPELIAHRGHAARYPENSLSAVRGALEAGARFVEVDVQLSLDRVPFLYHDRTCERVSGAEGTVHGRTAAQIAGLRAHEPGRFGERFADEPVASLGGLVELLGASPGVFLFVELKRVSIEAHGVDAVLDAVLPLLEPVADRAALISFSIDVLLAARARSRLPLGPVLESWDQLDSAPVAALAPELVFCNVLRLPADLALAPGAPDLAVYEIDDADEALRLAAAGARWVETFAIAELAAALAARGAGA